MVASVKVALFGLKDKLGLFDSAFDAELKYMIEYFMS